MINPQISEKEIIEFFDENYDGLIDKFVTGFIAEYEEKIVLITSYDFTPCTQRDGRHKNIMICGVYVESMKSVSREWIVEDYWETINLIHCFDYLKLLR